MKRWRGALVLALAGALALVRGGEAGTGSWPSGLKTYTFQEGVYPTSGYTGCSDTYVHNDSAGVALKIRNFGAMHSLNITSATYTGGEQGAMIKFAFLESDGVTGGIPANFVCTYARLGLYKISTGVDGAATPGTFNNQIYLYRCLVPWTEGSGTGIAAGFANYDSATSVWPWVFDSQNVHNYKWRTGAAVDNGSTLTDSASALTGSFFGTDSIYRSYSTSGTVASGDYGTIPYNPTDIGDNRMFPSGSGTNARTFGRIYFDVTHDISLMLAGAIQNNGWVITNSGTGIAIVTGFASAEFSASKNKRPSLEVWGYTISSGGTSGRRRAGF